MAVVMTVHGRHGGMAEIMDDELAKLTPERQAENRDRMVGTAAEILERFWIRKFRQGDDTKS